MRSLVIGILGAVSCTVSQAEDHRAQREAMVRDQIEARGVKYRRVLDAMRKVARHRFVSDSQRGSAYADRPLPIGQGQTISQPYVVALMTEAAKLTGTEKVLEIGTGSGYQAAVLAEIVREVWTIEIVPELAAEAASRLRRLGYKAVHVRTGDGYRGWPEVAPFDAIVVTAAPEEVPEPLLAQLAVGGRLVMPMGPAGEQSLYRWTRTQQGVHREKLLDVRFVPMTGETQGRRPSSPPKQR